MIAHSVIARSIPAHSKYLSTLFGSCCSDVSLLVSIARSSAYGDEVIVIIVNGNLCILLRQMEFFFEKLEILYLISYLGCHVHSYYVNCIPKQ